LLIDRKRFPFCWAGVAGHIEEGEKPEEAAKKELREEVGLKAKKLKLVLKKRFYPNPCRRGGKSHFWWVFKTEWAGKVQVNKKEVKEYRWLTKEQLAELMKSGKLELVWEKIFNKIKILG
jgi:8-oxo-dGTP pyrophosphatase MutT (NUDIX family)